MEKTYDVSNEILLTTKEAAKLVNKAPQTLINDRHKNRGLPYVRLNGSIRYLRSDVLDNCYENRVIPANGQSQKEVQEMTAKKTPRIGLQTGRGAKQDTEHKYNSRLANGRQSIDVDGGVPVTAPATSSRPAVEAIGGRYGK